MGPFQVKLHREVLENEGEIFEEIMVIVLKFYSDNKSTDPRSSTNLKQENCEENDNKVHQNQIA